MKILRDKDTLMVYYAGFDIEEDGCLIYGIVYGLKMFNVNIEKDNMEIIDIEDNLPFDFISRRYKYTDKFEVINASQ